MNPITIPPGSIDPVIRSYEGEFQLGRGEYVTAGAWAYGTDFTMLRGSSVLRGSGSRNTVLRLANPGDFIGTIPCTYYQLLTGGGYLTPGKRTEVSGLSVDAAAAKPVKAIQVWGTGVQIRDVVVVNLSGRREVLEGEGFGLLVNNSGPNAIDGGNRIENCLVQVVPGSYVCAVYMGTELTRTRYPGVAIPHDRTLLWSEVRDTVAVSVTNPENRSHCGFGINSRTRLIRCQAHGFDRAIFSDTGDGIDAEIREFYASGCSIGVEFRSNSAAWPRRRILVEDSTFVFGGGKGGYVAGLVLVDDTPKGTSARAEMSDIVFRGCRFVNESGQPGHVGSSSGAAIAPAVFEGCQWIGKWDRKQAETARWQFVESRFPNR
jgi:hypothetical protein